MRHRWPGYLLMALVLAFFAVFLVWPIWETLHGAFGSRGAWTAAYLIAVFKNPVYVEGLLNAVRIAATTTLLVTLIALPLAWLATRYDFPGKTALTALLLVPMILPPFVGAIGIKQVLGEYGMLNSLLRAVGLLGLGRTLDWFGSTSFLPVTLIEALSLYPILYLNASAALANVDPALEEAAEGLGGTGWRKFRRITLPLIMPGLFAGGTLVFIWSFTELGTPLLLGYNRVTPVQIFNGIREIGTRPANPFPYALTAVMLAASVLMYLVGRTLFGRGAHAMMARATSVAASRRVSGARAWLVVGPFIAVIAIAILPHVTVLLLSLTGRWYDSVVPTAWTLERYRAALGHRLTVPSIMNSMQYASLAMLVDVVLGVIIAYILVRTTLPGRSLLDALSVMPLAVPGLVMAFGYLAMTQEGKPLAFLVGDPKMPDPFVILVIAYAVRRMPYVVRSAVAGMQQTSATLEEAACNLGASPVTTLRRITVPLIAANLIAGALLAFALAMLEVSDSLILAQRAADFPITNAIYLLFQMPGDGRYLAAALGVWAMAFLMMTLLLASQLLGKRLGAMFRI
jgi:iron(III) transport system permease protein